MDINTCYATTHDYYAMALYSHLIPVAITLIVSFFVLVKSKYSSILLRDCIGLIISPGGTYTLKASILLLESSDQTG